MFGKLLRVYILSSPEAEGCNILSQTCLAPFFHLYQADFICAFKVKAVTSQKEVCAGLPPPQVWNVLRYLRYFQIVSGVGRLFSFGSLNSSENLESLTIFPGLCSNLWK